MRGLRRSLLACPKPGRVRPGGGTQIETDYLPPGHPPTIDMLIDVAALRAQWEKSGLDAEEVFNYGPGDDAQKYTAHHKATGHIR